MYKISISQVKTFTQCRRKYQYQYKDNITSDKIISNFMLGNIIHITLYYYYSGIKFEQAIKMAVKLSNKRLKSAYPNTSYNNSIIAENNILAVQILQHYQLFAHDKFNRVNFSDKKFKFLNLEQEFTVPLYISKSNRKSSYISLAGIFDGIVEYDGNLYLLEHKTTSRIDSLIQSLENDIQATAYLYATQQIFKKPVTGIIYNIIRKKVPTKPKVLQNGLLSQNKQLSTTLEEYLYQIKKHHPTWTNSQIVNTYADMIANLTHENTFFVRHLITRSQATIDNFANELYTLGLEIVRPSTNFYPNRTALACKFCQFYDKCLAQDQNKYLAVHKVNKKPLKRFRINDLFFDEIISGVWQCFTHDNILFETETSISRAYKIITDNQIDINYTELQNKWRN